MLSRWISPGAAYDSQERFPAPRCHPGTRTELLNKIEEWIGAGAGRGAMDLLWLHGPAGAGKSAIAQTVAEICAERGQLAASFFFSRSSPDRNALKHLFPTIAVQSPCLLLLNTRSFRRSYARTRTSPIVSLAPSNSSSRFSVTRLVHFLTVERDFHHLSSSSLTVSTSVGATMIN